MAEVNDMMTEMNTRMAKWLASEIDRIILDKYSVKIQTDMDAADIVVDWRRNPELLDVM